jgi:protein-S-isoprenylcysteine O-methyltransferase Ste14
MYSADIVLAWGAAIAYPLVALWASVCWFTVITIVWAYSEESILEKKFGEEYRMYKKNVPMWIPGQKTKN